ncbi:MAG: low-specificity L-threonine aldolase [Bacteroidetes bacterium]|nr:low-specificity L-threonine aldolase [Bacteroidota bacterium]
MIDFRSDTVTRPTQAMLQAMQNAKVGDDVFGDDPSINELQRVAAQMFGMEAALFCPSGTMTNQIAINVHTKPGDEVICEENSHVYLYEGGGIAKNSGCSVRLLKGQKGQITAQQVEEAIRADDQHFPKSRLVSLENTSNKGGGTCYSISALEEIKAVCEKHNLGFHLDGARLFNAMVQTGQNAKKYGELFDSISICLSKGLGCPVGSLLLGTNTFIYHARRTRKVFGGGMRQSGYLAAAGLYALENHIERLKIDHENAAILANSLRKCSLVETVIEPETNIVVAHVANSRAVDSILEILKSKGILAVRFGADSIRFVTHLDLSAQDIEQACRIIEGL